jgi:asparagine synthase (glutamine-hydrolysing)
MDYLFGTINFNKVDCDAAFNNMYDLIKHYEHVHYESIQQDFVKLGRLKRHFNEQSIQENGHFENESYILQFTGRIDNYKSLIDANNLIKNITINELVITLHTKFGTDFIKLIEGDWVLSLWIKQKEELLLARDILGNTAVYFHHNSDFFSYSSTLHPLSQNVHIQSTISQVYLLSILETYKLENGQTVYNSIYELPPAHYLIVNRNKIKKKRYWKIENVKPKRKIDSIQTSEKLRYLLSNSINKRIKGVSKLGTLLSAGLDSSAITVMASLENKKQKIYTYTSVPAVDTSHFNTSKWFTDESILVQSITSAYPNLNSKFVSSDVNNFIAELESIYTIHQQPVHIVGNIPWIHQILHSSQKEGVDTLFTGQLGNAIISWTGSKPSTYLDLLLSLFNRRIKIKDFIKKGYNLSFKSKRNKLAYQSNSFINKEFVNSSNYKDFIKKMETQNTYSDIKSIQEKCEIIKPDKTSIGSIWQDKSFYFNTQILDPTTDKELIEFCFSIPDHLHYNKYHNRLLIRQAMKGFLPDDVRLNKKRGKQGSDLGYLIQQNKNKIISILKESENSEYISTLIDLPKMVKFIEQYTFLSASRELRDFIRCFGVALFLLQSKKI